MNVQKIKPITTIAADIKLKRLSKRYSQQQLALKMGVDKTTISAWERDVRFPKEEHLLQISECLGLPLMDLLRISKNRKSVG
ncbi:XRE family transcriptional regulator [Paenibacillus sp. BGI2013]|uniref:Helix-turn-helix transcriptional regulator n=1 Tax=Paenibacillus amylolyticus TaxID=1451 RepID=A0ABD8B2R4_PAEAM|nr:MULTISPECIES: helix-turn-helix transcriptional regulator [unclassified Paenibacillus]PJN64578.1 hypothetical protein PAEAM_06640 [Paenibacillus sp. GM1FR]PKQ89342.1 XRE family transcriptional regulator [Paenibacillus sp. BGI2013]